MLDIDNEKMIRLGHKASSLLENKAFAAAFHCRMDEHMLAWLETKPEEIDKREHYWRVIHELMGVVSLLEGFKEDAEVLSD